MILYSKKINMLPALQYKCCPFCEGSFDCVVIGVSGSDIFHDDYHCLECGHFGYINERYEGKNSSCHAYMTEYTIGDYTIRQYWRVGATAVYDSSQTVAHPLLTLSKILEVNLKNTFETLEKIRLYLIFS